mmetsp:Transcript_16561/g.39073  ORF Transcript_16561/g.39073 Transcript_16561/m.39073 type:complete len:496 (-) Transcript_16561:16-1503(-)
MEEASVGDTRQAALFLGVEQHAWDCADGAAGDSALSQEGGSVERGMWEWASEFPRLSLDHVTARAGIDMLLIDINRSYTAISESLAHWSPYLSQRAAILAYGASSEGDKALLEFARETPLEAWAVYSAGDAEAATTLLLRDPDTQEFKGVGEACTCWGCGTPESSSSSPSVGEKWDVPGVYISVDSSRTLRMEDKIRRLGPKASISRFQGKDGATEKICQRVGKCNTLLEECTDTVNTVCCTLSHWFAIHSFFKDNVDAEYFVILEDDVLFDLVPFWPGTLLQFLDLASDLHPGWQIVNLAPSNWRNVSQWLQRQDPFVAYDFAPGKQRLYGAVMYAVRRGDELEQLAEAVVQCTLSEKLVNDTGCYTRINQVADWTIFASVSHAFASAMPLVRIDSVPSVRVGGQMDTTHMDWARDHWEAWNYVAFLHQVSEMAPSPLHRLRSSLHEREDPALKKLIFEKEALMALLAAKEREIADKEAEVGKAPMLEGHSTLR